MLTKTEYKFLAQFFNFSVEIDTTILIFWLFLSTSQFARHATQQLHGIWMCHSPTHMVKALYISDLDIGKHWICILQLQLSDSMFGHCGGDHCRGLRKVLSIISTFVKVWNVLTTWMTFIDHIIELPWLWLLVPWLILVVLHDWEVISISVIIFIFNT